MIIARVFAGLCGNLKVPVNAYVADVSKGGQGAANFAKLSIALGLALVAGPSLSLLMLHSTGGSLRAAVGMSAVLTAANILLVCAAWPVTGPPAGSRAPWKEANPIWLVRNTIMRTRRLQIFGAMSFLDAFTLCLKLSTTPLFTRTCLGWKPSNFSLYLLALGLLTPAMMRLVMTPLVRRKGEAFVLRLGYAATCLSFLAMFLAGLVRISGAFYATSLLFALGMISNPVQLSLAARELPQEEYGRLSGSISILETLGKVVAPFVGGAVLNRSVGGPLPSLVYLVGGVMLMPGVALAFAVSPPSGVPAASSGSSPSAKQQDLDAGSPRPA